MENGLVGSGVEAASPGRGKTGWWLGLGWKNQQDLLMDWIWVSREGRNPVSKWALGLSKWVTSGTIYGDEESQGTILFYAFCLVYVTFECL